MSSASRPAPAAARQPKWWCSAAVKRSGIGVTSLSSPVVRSTPPLSCCARPIGRIPTGFQKTLGLNDFYFGDEDHAFPLGHIQMLGKTDAAMFQGEAHRLLPAFEIGRA